MTTDVVSQQAKYYNLRHRPWSPKIGDLVVVKQHQLSKAAENFTSKLAPKFKGPFLVTGFKSPNIVTLKHPQTKKIEGSANIQDLKIFYN